MTWVTSVKGDETTFSPPRIFEDSGFPRVRLDHNVSAVEVF